MLATILKYVVPGLLILILAVIVLFGAFYVGKQEGSAITQAKQDAAVIKNDNKLDGEYAKIQVPRSRTAAVERMLMVAKAHNIE